MFNMYGDSHHRGNQDERQKNQADQDGKIPMVNAYRFLTIHIFPLAITVWRTTRITINVINTIRSL